MSRTEFNIGSDDSDDELNFQLNGLETPGTRKRRRARLIASAGTTPRDHQVTATGALESGGSGRGSARKRAPTPKQKALDEAAVAATTRPKKARGKQSHHEPAMPAVPEHAVVWIAWGQCLLLPQGQTLQARRLAEPEAAGLLCPPRAPRALMWRTARQEERTQCPKQLGSRNRRSKLRPNRLRGDSPTRRASLLSTSCLTHALRRTSLCSSTRGARSTATQPSGS